MFPQGLALGPALGGALSLRGRRGRRATLKEIALRRLERRKDRDRPGESAPAPTRHRRCRAVPRRGNRSNWCWPGQGVVRHPLANGSIRTGPLRGHLPGHNGLLWGTHSRIHRSMAVGGCPLLLVSGAHGTLNGSRAIALHRSCTGHGSGASTMPPSLPGPRSVCGQLPRNGAIFGGDEIIHFSA